MLEITSEKKIEIRARSFQIPAEDDQTPAEQYLAMFAEEL
jgi:hypothetical protein